MILLITLRHRIPASFEIAGTAGCTFTTQVPRFIDNNEQGYYSKGIRVSGSSSNPLFDKVTIDGSRTGLSLYYKNGAPKPAALSPDLFAFAQGKESAGDRSGAIRVYKEILAENTDSVIRRAAVKSILHDSVQLNAENKTNDYSEVRSIVLTELNSATSAYKAALDYLLCEILVKEGKYSDAVSAYTAKAAQYAGTYMEVEMLTRAATL